MSTNHNHALGPAYIYHHIVSFEETNLVGNVYFSRHVAWQGRCREMFLREHAPELLDDLSRNLLLVTTKVNCEYFRELHAFDEIQIQMELRYIHNHKIGLSFDYLLIDEHTPILVARGTQEIGCMGKTSTGLLLPTPVPSRLAEALSLHNA